MNTIKELALAVDERMAELINARCDLNFELTKAKRDHAYAVKNDRGDFLTRVEAKIVSISQRLSWISVECSELNNVWLEEGCWTRAFLVTNSNGHVHNTMDCGTCFPTTRFEWLTEYSSDNEDTIVGLAGELACTVCYPSAPADILNQPSTIQSKNRAEKEEAAAKAAEAKAARTAKKKASAPTDSGDSILVPSRWSANRMEEIKTERTAVSAWYEAQDSINWDTKNDRVGEFERYTQIQSIIEEALAGKHGVTEAAKREELLRKYSKRKG
jgi:hypothetical protein